MSSASRTALVLAVAVAKGAFQAGALEVPQRGCVPRAGSQPARAPSTVPAGPAPMRAGRENEAAKALPALWSDGASIGMFHRSLGGILGERGLSTGARRIGRNCAPAASVGPACYDLRPATRSLRSAS